MGAVDPKVWLAVMFGALAFYMVALIKMANSDVMYAALTLVFVAASIMPMFVVSKAK